MCFSGTCRLRVHKYFESESDSELIFTNPGIPVLSTLGIRSRAYEFEQEFVRRVEPEFTLRRAQKHQVVHFKGADSGILREFLEQDIV